MIVAFPVQAYSTVSFSCSNPSKVTEHEQSKSMIGARFTDSERAMIDSLEAENHSAVQGEIFGRRSPFSNRGPTSIYSAPNGAELYVAGDMDLWEEHGAGFLRTLHPKGQVFTCKNETPPEIRDACARAGWPKSLQIIIGYGRGRADRFDEYFI